MLLQTRQLVQVCESPLVEMGIARFAEAKRAAGPPQPAPAHRGADHTGGRDSAPEDSWKWSGTDFVKSPTEEPWVSAFYCNFLSICISFGFELFICLEMVHLRN